MIGSVVSHYKIVELLGKGGMGVVYKAEDTRLGRFVALKFLPEAFLDDYKALERFKREARAASSINHPHICTIYDIGEHNGQPFIAMELLVGQTLKDLIREKPLPIPDLIAYSIQISDALHAAHSNGIVHRDIKPANIFITSGGYVKLLDFGLAKPAVSPTAITALAADVTIPGTPIGTILYMSPEQARGETLDSRTDLFSLGVVLYEMATGRKPFALNTADLFEEILNRTPTPPVEVNNELPAELQRIILKALEKARDARYQSAKEILTDIRGMTTPALARHPPLSRRGIIIVTSVVVGSILAALIVSRGRPDTNNPPGNLSFQQITMDPAEELFPAISPDGRSVAYAGQGAANWDIYLQRIGGQPIDLTKDSLADDTQPAFSPDGEKIVFRSERQGGGLFVMGATGESVRRLTDFGFNPAWSPDGTEVLFATERIVDNPNSRTSTSQLWAVNIGSGAKRLVSKGDAVQPNWSPDKSRIAYWTQESGSRDIWTMAADGSDPVRVTNDSDLDWNPVWSPDGRFIYFCSDRGGSTNIWRMAIEKTGKTLGTPQQVTTGGVGSRHHFSFSKDGRRLAYVEALVRLNLQKIRFDDSSQTIVGDPIAITQGARLDSLPSISPDGEWLAFSSAGKQEDLFLIRTDGTDQRQLTDDAFKDRLPRWSPDGQYIAFYSNRGGGYSIWTIKPDGSSPQQVTRPSEAPPYPVWSPDGKQIAFRISDGSAVLGFDGGKAAGEPSVLPRFENSELFQVWSWSPDGKWLAGERILAGPETPRGIAIYSIAGGTFEKLLDYGAAPVWLSDSRHLLFWSQSKIQMLDRVSKEVSEVMNISPKAIDVTFTVSPDNRILYFTSIAREADVWLLSLP